MDEQARDELRERNRRRAYACRNCGNWSYTQWYEGREKAEDEISGFWYRECLACGFKDMRTKKPR